MPEVETCQAFLSVASSEFQKISEPSFDSLSLDGSTK